MMVADIQEKIDAARSAVETLIREELASNSCYASPAAISALLDDLKSCHAAAAVLGGLAGRFGHFGREP